MKVPEQYQGAEVPHTLIEALTGNKTALLMGKAGTGKTRALWAYSVRLEARQQEKRKQGVSMDRLMRYDSLMVPAIEIDRRRYDWDYADTLAHFRGLLMLDDVGYCRGHATDWQVAAMHHVLSVRLDERLCTLITTNLDLHDIAEHFTPAIASRMSSGAVVCLGGKDWRQE